MLRTDLVVEEGPMLGGYYAQKVINLIDRKTAIFVLSDIGAMGLIRGLNELGILFLKTFPLWGMTIFSTQTLWFQP